MKRLPPEDIIVAANLLETNCVAVPSGDLDQIVLDLCLNSRDAMPNGGELSINSKEEEGSIIMTIKDTGIGTDSNDIAKSTDFDFTTKTNGYGYGLAMVKKTLEKY